MGDVGDYWRERDAYRKRKDDERINAGLSRAERRKIAREISEWNRNHTPSDKDFDIEI